MAVAAIQNYQNTIDCNIQNKMNVSFEGKKKGKTDLGDNPDSFEKTEKAKASTAKKIGLGMASGIAPGLGQLINGEVGKGLAFFGATVLAGFLRGNAFGGFKRVGVLNFGNIEVPLLKSVKSAPAMYIGAIAGIGAQVWSVIDAIINAKPDAKEA